MERERGLDKRKAKCHVAETLITDGHRDIFIAEVPECVLLGIVDSGCSGWLSSFLYPA